MEKKTLHGALNPVLPRNVAAHYETLRAQVFNSHPSQDYGWAVLIRCGLLAWSAVASKDVLRSTLSSHRVPTAFAGPVRLNHRVIQVLAGMVVQLQLEVPHGR